MNIRTLLAWLVVLTLLFLSSAKLSLPSLKLQHSNQGYVTDYLFQFTPEYPYLSSSIRIGFPIDFILSDFQQELECYTSQSGKSQDFVWSDCWIEPSTALNRYFLVGDVVIQTSSIKEDVPFFILLRNIANPIQRDLTSYFSLCIELDNTPIQCESTFARALLTPPAPSFVNQIATFSSSPLTLVVGQATTYIFTIPIDPLGTWYSDMQFLSIRVIFPKEFNSSDPQCSLAYQLSNTVTTYVPFLTEAFESRPNSIECIKINNFTRYIKSNFIKLQIRTILNPLQQKAWTGIKFELVRSIHNQIQQLSSLSGNINVVMETFKCDKLQTNFFRNATTQYFLYLNHDVILIEGSTLQITIGNGSYWNIHSAKLMFGFTSPNTTKFTISQTPTKSIITLSNFGKAPRQVRQAISFNLTSPLATGYHFVSILAKINTKKVGYWENSFLINQTYGQASLLSLSAVKKKVKLGAGATGPLQLTFFLNYQLPESDGLKNGSIQLSVSPQLQSPQPEVNGVLKCYFKATYQASNCTLDNSNPTKTKIILVSPPLEVFQYSELPIIITTQGAIDDEHTGFPIDPTVTRYLFQTQFYLYNSSTIPSQVYYSEWIADSVEMSTATIRSLTYQCNEETELFISFTVPSLSTNSLTKDLRLMVQFVSHPITKKNAWHPALGYQTENIYKQYPCIVAGLTGSRISCDLYTYNANSKKQAYNNLAIKTDFTGPFFIIYGFENTGIIGSNVKIYLPKIKIGSIPNIEARVRLTIIEETPAQLQPYVQLYFQNITAFITLPGISISLTSVPSSQINLLPVQTWQKYNITWTAINSPKVSYVKYQISSQYFPSFQTKLGSCFNQICRCYKLFANWIVQDVAIPLTNPHQTSTLSNFIATIPFVDSIKQSLPIYITTYDSLGNTIDKIFMTHDYTPQSIVGYFDFFELTYYAGLPQWYSFSFSNAPVTVSQYPFITVQLTQDVVFSSPLQCNSTTFLPFNASGVQFKLTSSSQIIIYNIKQISPSGTYQFNCRLKTIQPKYTTMVSPAFKLQLHHNYSIGPSLVGITPEVVLQQAPILPNRAAPHYFTIDNPQIINQMPRVNYVGSLFLDFTFSDNNIPLNGSMDIVLQNHIYNKAGWTTPTTSDSDPPVCKVNNRRQDCSWKNNPLKIYIDDPKLKIGKNTIQITSEYVAPQNGVKFPGAAGEYLISIVLKSANSTKMAQTSFYTTILPPDLLHMQVSSIVKDIGTESVFMVNFTYPTWLTPANSYTHLTNYSRIFIEFPTEINGNQIFLANLGGYTGHLNERVGCSFSIGIPYISPLPGKELQCRFIPPQFVGGRVKIEVINHNGLTAALNSMAVLIYKVFNPAIAYSSVDLWISIQNYEVGTGHIFPLYTSKYTLFLDPYPKNSNPIQVNSIDDPSLVPFFEPLKTVGQYGYITLTAQASTLTLPSDPYYVLFKLPYFLSPESIQLTNQVSTPFPLCSSTLFEFCTTSREVQYVLVKVKSSPATFRVNIRNFPTSISQKDTIFTAMIIEQGRYTANIIYNISSSFRWKGLGGTFTSFSITLEGSSVKADLGREKIPILISFRPKSIIPKIGTIQIIFPSSITKIYPHCRSAIGLGSTLSSQSGIGPLGLNGEIGCSIQNGNHWVITNFEQILNSSLITIRGEIDLPNIVGSLGIGQIISYTDYHFTDIFRNGSPIDYLSTDFTLIISSTQAMNINSELFLTQRSVLRKDTIGQFRYLFTLSQSLLLEQYIELSLYKTDIKDMYGGFSLSLIRPTVCEFIKIDNEQRIGCYVEQQTETFIFHHQVIMYKIKTTENLLAGVTYQLRLTSQCYSPPEGISYPSKAGTFKIDFLTNHTSTSLILLQQKYIEVVGLPFNYLILTQFNFEANYFSPFWLQFAPSVLLDIKKQIIIEFPTISNDGSTRLFLDDLGWTSAGNGGKIPTDMFDCALSNNFMSCRIVYGSYLQKRPAKIICGNLLTPIAIGQIVRFAFSITNPSPLTTAALSQLSLPVFVYAYDPIQFRKINFNTINVGVVINNANKTAVPNSYFSTDNNQLQMPNERFKMSRYNTLPLAAKDFYVVKFNFPLRVNDKKITSCTDRFGTIIGTIYYHQNLQTVICFLTTGLAASTDPILADLFLTSFYTPWYGLNNTERIVLGIASYQKQYQSDVINYFDPFPLLPPRTLGFLPKPIFTLTPVLAHNQKCQLNDYIFMAQLQSTASTNTNLQYTKQIIIAMPSAGLSDFSASNTDCMEYYLSQVEVSSCRVDIASRSIIIDIVPKAYTNGKTLYIITQNLAIQNPCNTWFWSSWNSMQWSVQYLTSENGNALAPYMLINSGNMVATSLLIDYQHTVSGFYSYNPFSWFQVTYQRYHNQFLQFKSGQYSPFSFEFQLTTAVPATTFNKLKIQFGSSYIPCGSQSYVDQLQIFTPVCYLFNTRIQRCFVDTSANTTTMQFDFSLPVGTKIHAYFSVIDPRNPHLNGYSYIGGQDLNKLLIKLQTGATTYLFQTLNFQAFQSQKAPIGLLPARGITYGTLDYANNVGGQLNVLDMKFDVSRNDIKALKFQIPTVDEYNNPIFGGSYSASFFDLKNGDEYPCGNNQVGIAQTSTHKCYIFFGKETLLGSPVEIIMTPVNQGASINARVLLMNPNIHGMSLSIKVKAYTGVQDTRSIYGSQMIGSWVFSNIFQINSVGITSGSYDASTWWTTYLIPSRNLWRELNTWTLSSILPFWPSNVLVGDFVIMQVLLSQWSTGEPDDQVCRVNFPFGNARSDDMIMLRSKQGRYQKAFFIKKWTGGSWFIDYFKCKHLRNRIKVWYSYLQTSVTTIDYTFTYYYPYNPAVGGALFANYFYIFPLDKRTYIEIDLTSAITTILAQGFIWDKDVLYNLIVSYSYLGQTPQKCIVVEGIENNNLKMPVKCTYGFSTFTLTGFTSILLNQRLGRYRIKIQLEHNSYSVYTSYTAYSYTISMYAHQAAPGSTYNDWYIFTTPYTTTSNIFMAYFPTTDYCWIGIGCPAIYLPVGYSHYKPRPTNDFEPGLAFYGMNAGQTSIQFRMNLRPKIGTTIPMRTAGYTYSYPQFRFLFNNYIFSCWTFNRFIINLHRWGNVYPLDLSANPNGIITCSRPNQITVNFYYYAQSAQWGSIWGIESPANSWGDDITLQFDVQFSILGQVQPIYYRDWLSVSAFVDLFQYIGPVSSCSACGCYTTCGSSCLYHTSTCFFNTNINKYSSIQNTIAYSEEFWEPFPLLFGSVTIEPLSDVIGQSTEMKITLSNYQLSIGSSFGKILLLQIDQNINPFTYLNSSNLLMNRLQCKCQTSSTPNQPTDRKCYFRNTLLSGQPSSITIDIALSAGMSAICYFPQWKIFAGSLSITAKLINDYAGFPSYTTYTASNLAASYYKTLSNIIPFSNNVAPSASLTISEDSNPNIYSPKSYVNTLQSDYTLRITAPLNLVQPIVYIDFQKGGIIPDDRLCNNTFFLYCRVYTTYRHILVAKYKLTYSSGTDMLIDSNFAFTTSLPKHWEYGTNAQYHLIVKLLGNPTSYTHKANINRIAANLLPLPINCTVQPERSTGTITATMDTNVILNFDISNQTLLSYYSGKGRINITCSDSTILSTARGCTVFSVTHPLSYFYCQIRNSVLTIQNKHFTNNFASNGILQVIIGIKNPSAPITFKVTGYQYDYSDYSATPVLNYAILFEGSATYTPKVYTGVTLTQPNQLKMYPFNTKIFSDTDAPFRVVFKVTSSVFHPTQWIVINNLLHLSTFTKFQCAVKEFPSDPTFKLQTIFPNSFRNYKQMTQFNQFYVKCFTVAAGLQVQVPSNKGFSSSLFYELTVMPAGTTQTGFPNLADQLFRFIIHPSPNERIDQVYQYIANSFTLTSIKVVSKRPLSTTAILIDFNINNANPSNYPQHYFEILFRDIDVSSLKAIYQLPGTKVPCTLSALFLSVAGRTQKPLCNVHLQEILLNTVIVRVTQIGNIAAGAYRLTFDDFKLPNMVTPQLQNSSPFTLCMKIHNFVATSHYERCFDELFIIDYQTNLLAPSVNTGTMTVNDLETGATNVVGTINVANYPMASTSALHQKIMVRVNNGYQSIDSKFILDGYTLLWSSPLAHLYIYQQNTVILNSPQTFTFSNLTNPVSSEKHIYTSSPTMDFTWINGYHPISQHAIAQPLSSTFTLKPARIYATSILYNNDIKQAIPYDSSFIYKMQLVIEDSNVQITQKQIEKVQIDFGSSVSIVQRCWIQSQPSGDPYLKDGDCLVQSSRRLVLPSMNKGFANNNTLTIYFQMRISSNTITYDTSVFCTNKELQYFSSNNQFFIDVNNSQSLYPFIDFTPNLYTPYYYELISQVSRSTLINYLYFGFKLPADLIHTTSVFTIQLHASILPNNALQPILKCQWLTTDKYIRRFITGKHSVCSLSGINLIIQAPYGGLSRLDLSGKPIYYILKVRQINVIGTLFKNPTSSTPLQLLFTYQNGITILQDTLLVQPFALFNGLSVNPSTLTASQLNTYTIKFTPSTAILLSALTGNEAILELSIDHRYMPSSLGLNQLFRDYGTNTSNQTWIDNSGLNVAYSLLPNLWKSGIPYSGYTSTLARAQQTSLHEDPSRFKVLLTHQSTFSGTYIWKIPLLKNPLAVNMPYRMNLTLFTILAGTSVPQKELFYEIINPYRTYNNISSLLTYNFTTNALNTVQNAASSIDIDFGFPFIPNTLSVAQFKFSQRGVGIIGLTNFLTNSYIDTSYTFYFFKRLNLIHAHKLINDSSTSVTFGQLQTSNKFVDYYGYDWIKVHSSSSLQTQWNAGSLHRALNPCQITTVNSLLLQGQSTLAGSQFLYKFWFVTPCSISINSTVLFTKSVNEYRWSRQSSCYSSFRSMGCKNINDDLEISVDEAIAVGKTLTFEIYLQSSPTNTFTMNLTLMAKIYALQRLPQTTIIDIPLLATMPDIFNSSFFAGSTKQIVFKPLYENTYMNLWGRVKPQFSPINFIKINHPFAWTSNSHHRFLYRLNDSNLLREEWPLKWTQALIDPVPINNQTFSMPPSSLIDYSLKTNKQYTFLLSSTYDPLKQNNLSIGAVGRYYNFVYQSAIQLAYQQVYPVPVPDKLTLILPTKRIWNSIAMGVRFSMPLQSILIGDYIDIILDSHNLVRDMYMKNNILVQCAQGIVGILQASPILACQVNQYPASGKPMIIRVFPSKVVAPGTSIEIWMSPIVNPKDIMIAGVILKVTRYCFGQKRCQIYEARGYYKTFLNSAYTHYQDTVATFTPSNTEVYKTPVTHTFTFTPRTLTAAMFDYPENYDQTMNPTCTAISGQCIAFPGQKRVVYIPTTPTLISSLQLLNMRNGRHVAPPSEFVNLTVYEGSMVERYTVPHKNLTTIKTIPSTLAPNFMTITPTQSPFFLRNYMNTAVIKIKGLFTEPYITAFHIHAPSDIVTWDSTYCNSTLTAGGNNPYPVRLNCSIINDTTFSILVPQGVKYTSLTDSYFIEINCKFKIKDFPLGADTLYVSGPITSGTFNAYGSYSDVDDYHYYVTQASQTILISQHKIPQIGKVEFNEQSYAERLANVNEDVYFDMLYDPATTQKIAIIELEVPQQFGYPATGNHDACQMLSSTTLSFTSCTQQRRNGRTYLRMVPPANYDNSPVIITFANQNHSNWFKAPSLSGYWYNFTLSTYAQDGKLLERQYTENCSYIGGYELDEKKIWIQNGKDELQEEIVDISFVVGTQTILKGYQQGLLDGAFYTNIQISFENWNAFSNILKLSTIDGDYIGCSTRNIVSNKQIKCRLEIGNDIEHQPRILVSGYQQIPPNTNVTISLAKVQMLPKTKRNVAYIGVQLYRVGSWKESYLYDPRQLLLKQTAVLTTTPYLFLDIGYVGLNIVGSSSTFFLAFKPTVDVTSFIVVKFPSGFLSREYGKFTSNCSQGTVELFTRSDTIRIYPNTGIHNAGVLINYTITGFPSATSVITANNWPVKFQAYSSYRQIHQQTFSLGFQSYPCKFNFSLITASSLYIYDTTVSYTFQATLPIFSGQSQTFSLQVPSDYPSLFSQGIKLSITPLLDYNILTANTIQINRTQIAQGKIVIKINGITNPSNLSQTFSAATYSGDSLDALQCTSTAKVILRPIPQQQCQFTLSLSHYSISLPAKYTFTLLCPQTIRNSSTIKVALGPNYLLNNKVGPLNCWGANPLDLAVGNCELSYQNATVFVNFKNVRTELNQASIILNAIINNRVVGKDETFYSLSTINQDIYARTNSVTASFYSNPISKITSINMYNIPQAGGSRSIYALKVPNKFIRSTIQVDFPKPYDLSKNLSCSIIYSNNSSYLQSLSYFDLLQLSYSTQVSCTFSISIGRRSSISAQSTVPSTEVWAFLVLRHITNPSYWDPSVSFSVRSLSLQKQIFSLYQGGFDIKIGNPSSSIHMVGFETGQSDLVMLTTFKLSYRIDTAIFTNATSLILTPPEAQISLEAVQSLYCCLLINNIETECHLCRIGLKQIEFIISTQGLMLLPDDILSVKITQLYTPDLLNKCESLQDYLRSYFQLLIFRNGTTLTHSSIEPSADRFTPCKIFTPTRGDLLFAPPTEVYAGLAYQIPLAVSRPSKMLRILLRSPSFDITFTPSLVYFNSYDIPSIPTYLNVDPDADANSTVVQLSHEQSIVYNLLRDNRPAKIKIRNDTQQFVEVKQSQHFSVGQWVKIAVQLTHIASYDMYLMLVFDEGFALPLQIEESTILIPARTKTSYFSIRYIGDLVPPTIKLALQLTSAHRLRHSLRPNQIYFFFSVTPQFQTLPPVMKFSVLHTYSNNSQFQGRRIYSQQLTGILYDQLLPYIIKIENISIGATIASLRIYTRREATVHYVLLQRGEKFSNITPTAIRTHQQAKNITTSRNTSHYVNAYGILNLKRLQHQTIYCIYAMASDQFGDSINYVKHCIQTNPLTNAVEIRIDTLKVIEDTVRLVHALSDVLDVDILRVKDIDSYVIQKKVYIRDRQYQNQLLQRNTFIISPSTLEQLPSPWQLTDQILIKKEEGRNKLKTILPQFYDNFKERLLASSAEDEPIRLKVINLPKIKYPPKAISISYYSATLEFELWEKGIVFAIAVPRRKKQTLSLIEALYTKSIQGTKVTNLTDDIPYSKQIIKGKDSINRNISNHISAPTNDKGFARFGFNQLNPGTEYDIYVTFTTVWPYEPVIYANTEDIYQIAITTLENPNIKSNDEALIIRQLKNIDPQLYEIIKRNKAIRGNIRNIS